ncbi:MAG: hypothetical protein Q9O74_02220 [Planctomycetota bacterium]|nr:hypothetical protein [Planctomycetota bacterium]
MNRAQAYRVLARLICFGFAAMFGYAAWQKGLQLDRFAAELRLHGVLPLNLLDDAPTAIVWAEWVLASIMGLGVFSRHVRAVATPALVGLLVSMTLYLTLVGVTKGMHLSCGCAGQIEVSVGTAILRNVVLLGLAGVLVWSEGRSARIVSGDSDATNAITHHPKTGSFL